MAGTARQWCNAVIISIPNFLAVLSMVWPSYTIKILQGDETPLDHKITKYEENLIGSLVMLGSLISTIFVGFISDNIGRKNTLILDGLLFILSWTLTSTARSTPLILIGRVISGLAMGLQFVLALVFLSEICHPSIRGRALSFAIFVGTSGNLGSYLCGWFCSYQFICYLNITLAMLFVFLMACFSKETPIFLIKKGREKEALASLKFYRSASTVTQEILDEFALIKSQCIQCDTIVPSYTEKLVNNNNDGKEKHNETEETITKMEMNPWKILLTSKPDRCAFITLTSVVTLTCFTGSLGVQVYAGKFFSMAVPGLSPHMCSVILALVLSASAALSASVADLFGRRALMLSSSLICSLSLALLGSMLRWSWAPNWAIPLATMTFCLGYQLGSNNIPLVQIGESFGPKTSSLVMQFAVLSSFVSNFIILYLFGPCVDILGLDGIFFMFSLFSLFLFIIVYLINKETKGIPLETVREMYAQGYLYRKIK